MKRAIIAVLMFFLVISTANATDFGGIILKQAAQSAGKIFTSFVTNSQKKEKKPKTLFCAKNKFGQLECADNEDELIELLNDMEELEE